MRGRLTTLAVHWTMALLMAALTSVAGRAELRFAQPTVNAGVVRSGTPFKHCFSFVNAGREPVEILEARASCGCLSPRLEKRTLQPGEEGKIHVEINTLSQPAGSHTWTVHLKARCGDTMVEMPLQLSAELITEVSVQ